MRRPYEYNVGGGLFGSEYVCSCVCVLCVREFVCGRHNINLYMCNLNMAAIRFRTD